MKYRLPPFKAYRARDRYDPLIAADITGDGTPELFVPTNLRTKLCAFCNAPLRYDYLVAVTPGLRPSGLLPGWPKQFAFQAAEKAHGAGTPVVGDVDGDGDPEIVVGFGGCRLARYAPCSALWAFEPDGSVMPGFPKPTLGSNISALSSPAIADLDGDGITEVVFLDAFARLMVYEVPGTPGPRTFPWPMARQNPAHTNALPPAP